MFFLLFFFHKIIIDFNYKTHIFSVQCLLRCSITSSLHHALSLGLFRTAANAVVSHFTMASRRWRRTGLNTVHQVRTVVKAVTMSKVTRMFCQQEFALNRSNFHINLVPESHYFYCLLSLDSTVQPKFYCLLSPEASEDDISRLDSKVITLVSAYMCFNIISNPELHYTLTTFSWAGLS